MKIGTEKRLRHKDVINWEKYYQPERFEHVKAVHRRALTWIPQDYIPLGIHVADPRHIREISYPDRFDPDVFFHVHAHYLADTLEVGSDIVPVVGMNQLGDVLIPTMFGAEEYIPSEMIATLQDVGPTPKAVLSSIEQVETLCVPSFDTGILPQIETLCRAYRERLPEWIGLIGGFPIGPFSTAMALRGSEILVDVIDRPELCDKLMRLSAEMVVQIEKRIRGMFNPDFDNAKNLTHFGVRGTGLRLGDDSICNLSPEMIRRFCAPVYHKINQIWQGQGHIHCCSLAHSRFEHLYPAFLDMPEVSVFSSQFAFEYYREHLPELKGRLALESFYGDALGYVTERYGSFENWADEFVPKYRNESGLLLYCQVSSVQEGKRLWQAWQKAHGK